MFFAFYGVSRGLEGSVIEVVTGTSVVWALSIRMAAFRFQRTWHDFSGNGVAWEGWFVFQGEKVAGFVSDKWKPWAVILSTENNRLTFRLPVALDIIVIIGAGYEKYIYKKNYSLLKLHTFWINITRVKNNRRNEFKSRQALVLMDEILYPIIVLSKMTEK